MSEKQLLRPSDLSKQIGFSPKHWQTRARSGEIPSARIYNDSNIVFIAKEFWPWWEKQLDKNVTCPKTSTTDKNPGGRTRRSKVGGTTKSLTHKVKRQLDKDGTDGLKNKKKKDGEKGKYRPSEKLLENL